MIGQDPPVPDHVRGLGEGLVGAVDPRLDEVAEPSVVEVVQHVGDRVQLTVPGTLNEE